MVGSSSPRAVAATLIAKCLWLVLFLIVRSRVLAGAVGNYQLYAHRARPRKAPRTRKVLLRLVLAEASRVHDRLSADAGIMIGSLMALTPPPPFSTWLGSSRTRILREGVPAIWFLRNFYFHAPDARQANGSGSRCVLAHPATAEAIFACRNSYAKLEKLSHNSCNVGKVAECLATCAVLFFWCRIAIA